MKTITFAIPCYNSAEYMDACISSILKCGDDIEVIIVNDGSTKDDTSGKAHEWEARYPGIVRAIDQANAGHGGAVNTGLANANGLYFKVVDSDDWLDEDAMRRVMKYLRSQVEVPDPTDMVVANYVYEKVHEGTRQVMGYGNVFPTGKRFGWPEIGHFHQSQYLLMHSVIYRTRLLKDAGIRLPEHCFYVDNIFVYEPLPHVRTMYYLDVDMYRYFIGREDQSVNERVMLSRIDQQLRVTRIMIDAVHLPDAVPEPKLEKYMESYLSMMMGICSVFLRMDPTPENERKRAEIWRYLEERNPVLYRRIKHTMLNRGINLPTPVGRKIVMGGYHVAQKIFKFN